MSHPSPVPTTPAPDALPIQQWLGAKRAATDALLAANLALTLSESYERRVLLIDADLRRPAVSRQLASQARLLQDEHYDTALLLAVEATHQSSSVEARQALPELVHDDHGDDRRTPDDQRRCTGHPARGCAVGRD